MKCNAARARLLALVVLEAENLKGLLEVRVDDLVVVLVRLHAAQVAPLRRLVGREARPFRELRADEDHELLEVVPHLAHGGGGRSARPAGRTTSDEAAPALPVAASTLGKTKSLNLGEYGPAPPM